MNAPAVHRDDSVHRTAPGACEMRKRRTEAGWEIEDLVADLAAIQA
jgi:hypothetical protein